MSEKAVAGARGALDEIEWSQYLLPILSAVGLLVSAYLTWIHWSGTKPLCAGLGDCEVVNTSEYSAIAGIPVALLGFLMYLAFFAIGLLRIRREEPEPPELSLGVFTLALVGVSFSAYLTYLELYVIKAICPWCVTSAILVAAIFLLTVRDLRQVI